MIYVTVARQVDKVIGSGPRFKTVKCYQTVYGVQKGAFDIMPSHAEVWTSFCIILTVLMSVQVRFILYKHKIYYNLLIQMSLLYQNLDFYHGVVWKLYAKHFAL